MRSNPHLGEAAPAERAHLQLGHAGRASGGRQRLEGDDRLLVLMRLVQRLRP